MNQVETAQDIINNIIYKVRSVEIQKTPFTVKIVFNNYRNIIITGSLAKEIIEAEKKYSPTRRIINNCPELQSLPRIKRNK